MVLAIRKMHSSGRSLSFRKLAKLITISRSSFYQGILTYIRHTQHEFKLKFSARLKGNEGKYTGNSKE